MSISTSRKKSLFEWIYINKRNFQISYYFWCTLFDLALISLDVTILIASIEFMNNIVNVYIPHWNFSRLPSKQKLTFKSNFMLLSKEIIYSYQILDWCTFYEVLRSFVVEKVLYLKSARLACNKQRPTLVFGASPKEIFFSGVVCFAISVS